MILIISSIHIFFSYSNSRSKNITTSKKTEYQINKINEINDKAIQREPIEDSYFTYLSENPTLINKIENYNKETGRLLKTFVDESISYVIEICMPIDNNGEVLTKNPDPTNPANFYMQLSPDLHMVIDKISRYSLYNNATDLIYADCSIEQIISGLSGGSPGKWPENFRYYIFQNNITNEEFNNYIKLIDEIINDLDTYKIELANTPSNIH